MTTQLPQTAAALAVGSIAFRDLAPDTAEVLYRKLTLDAGTLDDAARTVEASLSSDAEIERPFGAEVLVHDAAAVNLARAAEGLPLLFGHDQDKPIGLVERVRLEGGKLRGLLRFSKNARASEIWQDVRDGFLKNVSIGYRIEKWEEQSDSEVIRVTRWTPFEASVVSVAADPAVGVGRAAGAGAALATRDDDGGGPRVVASNERMWIAKEKGRREEIRQLFGPFRARGEHFKALEEASLDDPAVSVDGARRQLFELHSGDPQPLAHDLVQAPGSNNGRHEQFREFTDGQGRRFTNMVNQAEAYYPAQGAALAHRALDGLAKLGELDKDAADLRYKRTWDIAADCLAFAGISTRGMSPDQLIRRALSVPQTVTRSIIGHSSSDFANILEDASNKALQLGYTQAPETWGLWCRTGNLPDFKQGNRPVMSAFSDLDVIYENGEYKYGTYSDLKEVLTLSTYGKLFSISRPALVNDDLNAFGQIPFGMGRAANRKVGDLAYNVLINGITATLNQDGLALFHATHGNYVAPGSGAGPSVATVDAAWTSMSTQTDPSGEAQLNIVPRFLLVPRALENSSRVLAVSRNDPAATTPNVANPFFERLEVVADARLDAADPLAWYLAASPEMVETVEVAFLNGQQEPFLESQNGWSTDGVNYKVRHDAVAAPLDFRGLYKNDGN